MFSYISMRRLFIALSLSLILGGHLLSAATLSGSVTDESGNPLIGTTVAIPALHRGTATDTQGEFTLNHLAPAAYKLEFSSIGYKSQTRVIKLEDKDVTIKVVLVQSQLNFPGIVVTGTAHPTEALNSPQSTVAVAGRELERLRGETVMRTIQNSPGVSLYTTGAGIAKPVIRGLTSQRVLVVDDGMRQEGQQWGDEHAPELDALDVDRIEVVRGPSSVLYGSDALGGVINVIGAEIPSTEHGDPELGGRLLLNGFSNNDQGAGALSLFGARGRLGYRGNLSLRDAGNTRTPDGTLSNSAMKETDGSGMVGVKENWGSLALEYGHFGTRLEIHEDPAESPDASGFQRVQHDKVHLHGKFLTQGLLLSVNGGWQKNHRREYEAAGDSAPGLDLNLRTLIAEVKAQQVSESPLTATVGLSAENQQNRSVAAEKLIPDFDMLGAAGFAYEQFETQKLTVSGGLRYDNQRLKIKKSEDLGVLAQTRSYDALTATLGAVVRPINYLAFAANLGRGWRSPTAFELFVDGVHEGTIRYEIGDSLLKPEKSLNIDFSVRVLSSRVNAEVAVYRNRINDYIYQQPTGEVDPVSGFDKYLNKQADATLTGGEFSLQFEATEWCVLRANLNVVHGDNNATNEPLPLIPANNALVGVKFTHKQISSLRNPYISTTFKLVDKQDRVPTYETATPGYGLVSLGAGTDFGVGTHDVELDLRVENLLDQPYRNHLSRYKAYALNPGRNISLKISVPFELARR